MDALIGTFHIDWKSMVAQAINFGIVFFLLYRFALRPLMKVLDERNQKIDTGLNDAEKYRLLLEETKSTYENELARARQESQNLMVEMKESVDLKKQELMKKTEEEVELFLLEGRKSLQFEKEKIIKDAENSIVDLVKKSLEKVLGEAVEGSIAEHVVHNAIEDIKKAKK